MRHLRGKRGEPLMFLGALLLVWIGVRAIMWTSPFPAPQERIARTPIARVGEPANLPGQARPSGEIEERIATAKPLHSRAFISILRPTLSAKSFDTAALDTIESQTLVPVAEAPVARLPDQRGTSAEQRRPERAPGVASKPGTASPQRVSRWSAFGWVYTRGSSSLSQSAQALRPASYGASQAGAILRYRLRPSSDHAPIVYGRGSKALVTGGEIEAALGLGARPMPKIPVVLHTELRAARIGGETQVRPSAFLATEIQPLEIGLGTRAEVYGQAGYVGGDFSTAFADGQVRLTRDIGNVDRASSVRIGAGAWAGVQKAATRLDIGPSLTADVRLGEVPLRIAVDYRLRVAGNAEPGNGVAITVSSGF